MLTVLTSLAFICCAALLDCASSRTIHVDVQAPWKRHSLSFIGELSEFLHDQQPHLFWQFADGMCASDNTQRIQSVITLQKHLQQLQRAASIDAAAIEEQEQLLQEAVTELHHSVFSLGTSLIPSTLHTLAYSMVGLGQYTPAVHFFDSMLTAAHTFGKQELQCQDVQRRASDKAFIVVYQGLGQFGTVLCSAATVRDKLLDASALPEGTIPPDLALQSTAGQYADWEHYYTGPTSSKISGVTAVLYGMMGLPDYCQLYAALHEAAATGIISSFSVRHSTPTTDALPNRHEATPLQGFGVFLDIKNMEYKNVDDSKAASAAQEDDKIEHDATSTTFGADDEVLGVHFANLFATHEEKLSASDLAILREELRELEFQSTEGDKEAGRTDGSMKVWKMRDLGLQTLQSIYSEATKNTVAHAMEQFSNIVNNFPALASRISSTKVSAKVRGDVEEWYMSGMMHMLPQDGVFVNGRFIDLSGSTFNVFNFLSTIRKELDVTSKMSSLQLSAAGKKRVLQIAQHVGKNEDEVDEEPDIGMVMGKNKKFDKNAGPIRIDVSKGGKYVVNFLNNIERDPQYQGMQRSLKQLLYPSWSIMPIGRNLYTMISIIDPLSAPGASILLQTYMLMEQQYPLRFGVVFACKASAGSSRIEPLNEEFCRLFAQLKEKHSSYEATQFAVTVASRVLEIEERSAIVNDVEMQQDGTASTGTQLVSDDLRDMYVSSVLSGSGSTSKKRMSESSILSEAAAAISDSLHTDFIRNCTAYLEARGLPVNSFSLNGILSREDNIGGYIMQLLMREQQNAARLLRYRRISDKTKSLFSAILSNSRTYPRYHPILDEQSPEYVDFTKPEGETLMQNLMWIDSWSTADNDTNALSSSSILLIPPTRVGFSVAASALRFVTAAARSRVSSDSEGSEDAAAIDGERMALVINTDSALPETLSIVDLIEDMTKLVMESHSSGDWLLFVSHLQRILEMAASGKKLDALVSDTLRDLDDMNSAQEVSPDSVSFLKSVIREYHAHNSAISSREGSLTIASERLRSFKQLAVVDTSVSLSSIMLLYNGRKILLPYDPVDDRLDGNNPLSQEDLELIAAVEKERIYKKLKLSWSNLFSSTEGAAGSDNLLRIASYCGNYNSVGGVNRIDVFKHLGMLGIAEKSSHSMLFQMEPAAYTFAEENDDLQIFFIIDPLSVAGQRASALVQFIHEHLQYSQHIMMVPSRDISEFPLQNFYRFVVSPEQAIAVDGRAESSKAVAKFSGIPRQHTLTVRMDIPEPWNVQSQAAVQDIDNLRCKPALCGDPGSTAALELTLISYALKNVLVSGQCFEGSGSSGRVSLPPTGLQLTLAPMQQYQIRHYNSMDASSNSTTEYKQSDTLVMQNLGYYQLQANPGLYILNLAAGRATELYTIGDFNRATDPSTAAVIPEANAAEVLMGGQLIAVRTFENDIHRLVVHKRPGKEHLSILEDSDEEDEGIKKYGKRMKSKGKESGGGKDKAKSGVWNSLFGSNKDSDSEDSSSSRNLSISRGEEDQDDGRIHVFSLATGHVYERLLRIMMLSVSRQASKPVKFWLFENYLSPTFKESVNAMEQEFGFEVGYVTYKWPQWLTQQTQQQRIIWGYKILFLDVLFPLSVKKVIYVDADQVVRADLNELWDVDLQGKPYGYTPFCTSREETLGFQFWRQGYWKDHLRGLPYHISALYVVDLQKFRRNAIGDTLRATYDRLSRDPNSLANLDQDLPNFAQHQVPIFSLPQEWLWCETWCSDETKKNAKTIDLCNNPMHKEPKLDMARRVISGPLFNYSWVELDEEIKALQRRYGLMSLQSSD